MAEKIKRNERSWTDEEIEELITCYEERKSLWDITSQEYSNRDEKELAYNGVDKEMSGISRGEYKPKWKVLRGQFMREVGLERKKKSGQSPRCHSRSQRPRSFWLAPRIETSGRLRSDSGPDWLQHIERMHMTSSNSKIQK